MRKLMKQSYPMTLDSSNMSTRICVTRAFLQWSQGSYMQTSKIHQYWLINDARKYIWNVETGNEVSDSNIDL